MKNTLLLVSAAILIIACGGTSEPNEPAVSVETAPEVSPGGLEPDYIIEVDDEQVLKVGELFGFEDFNWEPIFNYQNFGVSTPQILEGKDTECSIHEDNFSVLGKSPGTCSLKYPSNTNGNNGSIFITIKIIEK